MAINVQALRAELRNIRANPEDTAAGVRLMEAFGGEAEEQRYWDRVRHTREAHNLLIVRPDLLGALINREQLRSLPVGSLGREYLTFVERENLCPQALHETLEKAHGETVDRDLMFLRSRSHALHDLLHVLTGYGRDSAGEIALMAFTGAQDGHRHAVWLARTGCVLAVLSGRFDLLKMIRHARERGRRSPWMFAQDWLSLLDSPIDEVRRTFGLWPVPRYAS